MGKRKSVKIGPIDLVFILVSVAGFVFALIGIFVPWIGGSASSELIGQSSTSDGSALFSKDLSRMSNADGVFPIGLVRAFAIIGLVLAFLCAVGVFLKALQTVRIKGLIPFIFAVVTIVVGVLIAVFSFSYASSLGKLDAGEILKISYYPLVGMYFCAIGTIASGVMMLLKRG